MTLAFLSARVEQMGGTTVDSIIHIKAQFILTRSKLSQSFFRFLLLLISLCELVIHRFDYYCDNQKNNKQLLSRAMIKTKQTAFWLLPLTRGILFKHETAKRITV